MTKQYKLFDDERYSVRYSVCHRIKNLCESKKPIKKTQIKSYSIKNNSIMRYYFVGTTEDGTQIYEQVPEEEVQKMKELGFSDSEIAETVTKDHPLNSF